LVIIKINDDLVEMFGHKMIKVPKHKNTISKIKNGIARNEKYSENSYRHYKKYTPPILEKILNFRAKK
jgi:hypothetical protein